MAVPTNVEGEGAAEIVATMSERTQKVLLYFATVTFGLTALAALKGADIALEDVMDAWRNAGMDPVQFTALLAIAAPRFPGREANRMVAVLRMAGSSASTVAASGTSAFVDGMARAAASTSDPKLLQDAAAELVAQSTSDAGKSLLLKGLVVFGSELEVYADDAKLLAKLKATKAGEGGEWRKHMGSEKLWFSFCKEINKQLVRKGAIFEVQLWQQWTSKIPDWNMGGKLYVQKYFKEYKGYFPEIVDSDLKLEAVAEAMAHIEPQLACLDVYATEAGKIAELEKKIEGLEDKLAGRGSSRGRMKCNKCWAVDDHDTEDCPLTRRQAYEAREKIKAERIAIAAAAAANNSTSEGASPSNDAA